MTTNTDYINTDFRVYINIILDQKSIYASTENSNISLINVEKYQKYWDDNQLDPRLADLCFYNIKNWTTNFNMNDVLFNKNLRNIQIKLHLYVKHICMACNRHNIEGTGNDGVITYGDFILRIVEERSMYNFIDGVTVTNIIQDPINSRVIMEVSMRDKRYKFFDII